MAEHTDVLAFYGLTHNPFSPAVPTNALWKPPRYEAFAWRLESLVLDGGFAMISGEPGLGKSKLLQLLDSHLTGIGGDIVVGVMQRPQSSLSDFYREMGELFGVDLSPANRYGGFRALREKWHQHIQATLFRPVLLIDEAQEMASNSLTELRMLGSARFDSQCLLTVVLCGDGRLRQRFRSAQLAPLGSRIAARLNLEPYEIDELSRFLTHSLAAASAPHLMTAALKDTVIQHCAGSLRILCHTCHDLLALGAQRGRKQLDEQLFLEYFGNAPRGSAATQPMRRAQA